MHERFVVEGFREKAERSGDSFQAYLLYSQAASLAPGNALYAAKAAQHPPIETVADDAPEGGVQDPAVKDPAGKSEDAARPVELIDAGWGPLTEWKCPELIAVDRVGRALARRDQPEPGSPAA